MRRIRAGDFDLFVFEGTGLAVGLAAILGRMLFGRPYVFSSGDAVSPFLTARMKIGAPVFAVYERLLYRCCSGFIGWTPYLVGRALTLGARAGVTVPGWAPYTAVSDERLAARLRIRRQLGIPEDAIVFGIVGTLNWSKRWRYCYGAELIRAALQAGTAPYVLIVGDGTGLEHLRKLAGENLDKSILLPGRVSREHVPEYLAAIDVGSLPQSVDQVGSFRYTTKLSEYRLAALPFVTTRIPMSYDLDRGDIWRLPGWAPWSDEFVAALAALMKGLTHDQVTARRAAVGAEDVFSKPAQIERATVFLNDIILSLKS